MALSQQSAIELAKDVLIPIFQNEYERLEVIDKWARWQHDDPFTPRVHTQEYKFLMKASKTPWLSLVVTSVAQALFVEGYRRSDQLDNAGAWEIWQRNGMDARQIPCHRAALTYGAAYVRIVPGDPLPVMRPISPRRMITTWGEDPDEPVYALQVEPANDANRSRLLFIYDDEAVYYLTADSDYGGIKFIERRIHGFGVNPIVRLANMADLDDRAPGEVEPLISVASRINQTTFDRLVVQRFSSWKVRTISGMARPSDDEAANQAKLKLRVEDILIADDPDTKFGTLDATGMADFISARDADIRDLAAVSQTPPHHLLGQMANLSAEALAAAESSLMRRVDERKTTFGESWERALRLAALVSGDSEGAEDYSAQVRWRDAESRSLAQTADALGKLATMLSVPVEMLWEKIPGWTDQDVERAKKLLESGDGIGQLIAELNRQNAVDDQQALGGPDGETKPGGGSPGGSGKDKK